MEANQNDKAQTRSEEVKASKDVADLLLSATTRNKSKTEMPSVYREATARSEIRMQLSRPRMFGMVSGLMQRNSACLALYPQAYQT